MTNKDIELLNEQIKNTNECIKKARKDARQATILAVISIIINFVAAGVRLAM